MWHLLLPQAFLVLHQVNKQRAPAFLDHRNRPRRKQQLLEVRKDLFSVNLRLLTQQVGPRYFHNRHFLRPLQLRMLLELRNHRPSLQGLFSGVQARSGHNQMRDLSSAEEVQQHLRSDHPVYLVVERLSPTPSVVRLSAQLHQQQVMSSVNKRLPSEVKQLSGAQNQTSSVKLRPDHLPTTFLNSSALSSRVEIFSEVFQHHSLHLKRDSREVLSRAGVKFLKNFARS